MLIVLIRRPSLLSGVLTGVDFSITLCCVPSVCAFRTIVDSERFNWSISTYLVSTKAGECGLTRGTCFVAGRLELAAVGVLSWCAMSAAIFWLLPSFFSFLRTPTARCTQQAALSHIPL